jgi:hypothetical protein
MDLNATNEVVGPKPCKDISVRFGTKDFYKHNLTKVSDVNIIFIVSEA